ncbi:hypothetical protein HPB49_007022 [Dermacentor silvarum]|uniref:Uncharacterized protein n=1 Tax=Dermacentor silvarum TaxID=543639 RepID=A0ACB8D3F2_DERSI|nr:hypothetical protein HPB49_007022 [Dermacentor silvarum]
MPTNAELCKKIERLESLLEGKLDSVVEGLVAKIVQKLEDQGLGNISALADSVRFISQQYEEMRATFDGLSASNKALIAQNQSLTKIIASMEQYSRLKNIEIKGIPSTQGEDCSAILTTVADAIDCPFVVVDIDTFHRVASKSPQKNLIVRFCSRTKKNDFLRKTRKARLRTSMIGSQHSAKDKMTTFNEIVKWYRLNRQTMPPPHPGLTRKEAVLYRQLQTGSLLTPVLAKHVCPSVYTSDVCRVCAKERATAAHILWDCGVNPREASEKTTIPPQLEDATRIYDQETQLKAVQQVSAALERQRPSETEENGGSTPRKGAAALSDPRK